MASLDVKDFAQISKAHIEFGDLTILVGPQAAGKSLVLQWLKAAVDNVEIVHALREAGHDVKTAGNVLDLIFGEGMKASWKDGITSVSFNNRPVRPGNWTKSYKKKREGKVFFIPAHRALLLSEGWPAPFMKLNADTPVVARLFSQSLYQRFSGKQAAALFPVSGILKQHYRKLIDRAVFHGASVELENEGLRYRLGLHLKGGDNLPFMTWTAGQREFTPLLLGLYHVLPSRKIRKRSEVDWVIIEEPEMGLHPEGIVVVMLLVLDLLWRGYKVVISTHSPLVLDIVWSIQEINKYKGGPQLLSSAFQVDKPTKEMIEVLKNALHMSYRIFHLGYNTETQRVSSRDISPLNPEAEDLHEANWGGLTGFNTRFGEAVREAVNLAELCG